jgi:hypothetical protein
MNYTFCLLFPSIVYLNVYFKEVLLYLMLFSDTIKGISKGEPYHEIGRGRNSDYQCIRRFRWSTGSRRTPSKRRQVSFGL